MNPGFDHAQIAKRKAHVRRAILLGKGYGWLSQRWNVSLPGALGWCRKHVSEYECGVIAENGRSSRSRPDFPDLRDRLELIKLCRADRWSDAKISRALGLHPSALCQWIKRNAPDGIEDALSDFRDEPETTRLTRAA